MARVALVTGGMGGLGEAICIKMAAQAGIEFDFKCPLTAEYKVGRNWAETH